VLFIQVEEQQLWWVLAFSSLAAGISVLFISNFSSSVLIAKEIAYREPVQLQ
jgi:hypothetical protein